MRSSRENGRSTAGSTALVVVLLALSAGPAAASQVSQPAAPSPPPARIDRQALVTRHDPILREFDPESPLSVGNGEFAFTADVTGLQTFAEAFEQTIPLGTLSQWGWHSAPNPNGWSMETFAYTPFDSHGRPVGYADIPGDRRTPEVEWLRANPHRLHLGRIGFWLLRADGKPAAAGDLTDIEQRLDLWNGVLISRFRLDGKPVEVRTVCLPRRDGIAVRVVSPLLRSGRIGIELRFPYGTGQATAADWTRPEAHQTRVRASPRSRIHFGGAAGGARGGAAQHPPDQSPGSAASSARPPDTAELERTLDGDRYWVATRWSPSGKLTEVAKHRFVLDPGSNATSFDFVAAFSPEPPTHPLPGFDEASRAARDHWHAFWNSGGAIDLSSSKDPRWRELERRIVLSQYLTAIQCAGSLPPQETGLTFNSWEGKFHLEMHWWHAAHFALWDRLDLLEKSLGYYDRILPHARATATRQGYRGARWPKMTGPQGIESPSTIGPFLIWQQPHPIYYAELCYRARKDRATLEAYKDVVFATADFMASYANWDEATGRYVLGPPLQGAQEVFPKDRTFNVTFELAYWRWGLESAQQWRERLGLPRDEGWDRVLRQLAEPVVADGKYLFAESAPDSYTDARWRRDHPSVTGALGMLPGPGIDAAVMRRSLDWIWTHWNWPDTWGWDYPMVAMSAARLGDPEKAVDALLLETPKNHYRKNGHNHQRPGLTIYLPGNGGLLAAVAMMAAGWDGAPARSTPGFPVNGQWTVLFEGLRPLP